MWLGNPPVTWNENHECLVVMEMSSALCSFHLPLVRLMPRERRRRRPKPHQRSMLRWMRPAGNASRRSVVELRGLKPSMPFVGYWYVEPWHFCTKTLAEMWWLVHFRPPSKRSTRHLQLLVRMQRTRRLGLPVDHGSVGANWLWLCCFSDHSKLNFMAEPMGFRRVSNCFVGQGPGRFPSRDDLGMSPARTPTKEHHNTTNYQPPPFFFRKRSTLHVCILLQNFPYFSIFFYPFPHQNLGFSWGSHEVPKPKKETWIFRPRPLAPWRCWQQPHLSCCQGGNPVVFGKGMGDI